MTPIETVQALVEALEAANNGLGWYRDMCPQFTHKDDDEASEQIESALAAGRAILAAQETAASRATECEQKQPNTDQVNSAEGGNTAPCGDKAVGLDRLAALAGAATQGKWRTNLAGHGGSSGFVVDEIYVYSPDCGVDDVAIAADIADPLTGKPSEANAAFIAACDPSTVLALVEVAKAAKQYLRQYEDVYDSVDNGGVSYQSQSAADAEAALRSALEGMK